MHTFQIKYINLKIMHFFALCCIIVLQCMVQKIIKYLAYLQK